MIANDHGNGRASWNTIRRQTGHDFESAPTLHVASSAIRMDGDESRFEMLFLRCVKMSAIQRAVDKSTTTGSDLLFVRFLKTSGWYRFHFWATVGMLSQSSSKDKK